MRDYSLSQFPPKIRFWARVIKSPVNGCWSWEGEVIGGYGRMYFDNRTRLAHVISWYLFSGSWPKAGQLICHTCDNRLCTNPAHLYLGNYKTNTRDRMMRQRCAVGDRNGRAALTSEQVEQIRSKYTTEDNFEAIAREYGITGASVSNILNRKTWKHLTTKENNNVNI